MTMSNNRNPIKQWEITYPQSGETIRETFYACFPPCTYSICAKEDHADGNPHIHLGLKLKKALSKKKLLKWIEEKFPESNQRIHISPIKSWDNWNDYCMKEDPHCFVTGSLNEPRKRTAMVAAQTELDRVIADQEWHAKNEAEVEEKQRRWELDLKLSKFHAELQRECERAREHGWNDKDVVAMSKQCRQEFFDNGCEPVDYGFPNDLEQVRIGREERELSEMLAPYEN